MAKNDNLTPEQIARQAALPQLAQQHVDSFKRSNPNATKKDFAAFVANTEDQYAKNNPTVWPQVKEELDAALEAF
jgi:hypothetical protein